MSGLSGEKLADRKWEFFLHGFVVGLHGLVFCFLGGGEKGVVSSSELAFQGGPDTKRCAFGGAAFLDVVNTFLVEDGFKFAAELSALEGFGEEVALKSFVFELFADFLKAFLPIDKIFDDSTKGVFNVLKCFGGSGHKFLSTRCGICGHGPAADIAILLRCRLTREIAKTQRPCPVVNDGQWHGRLRSLV